MPRLPARPRSSLLARRSPGAAATTATRRPTTGAGRPSRSRPRTSSSRAATARRSARCAPTARGRGLRAERRRCCAWARTASASRCSTSRASRSTPDAVALYVAEPERPRAARAVRGAQASRCASSRSSMSRQTQADLDDVDAFWVADVDVPAAAGATSSPRSRRSTARWSSTSQIEMRAGARGGPPDVGEKRDHASHTDTLAGRRRRPRRDRHAPPAAAPSCTRTDFADVLGKEPVVLAFATPQLCQTRVCGPVVDVVAEVKRADRRRRRSSTRRSTTTTTSTRASAPQVGAVAAADRAVDVPRSARDGQVVERFEGAVSVRELEAAVTKLDAGRSRVAVERGDARRPRRDTRRAGRPQPAASCCRSCASRCPACRCCSRSC